MTPIFYVVSDLHLSEATPGINGRFLDFLDAQTGAAHSSVAKPPAIYLLGDIFEYWAGDDDLADPFNAHIVGALKRATTAGIDIGFLPGNRDFLIGEGFAAATGVRLLPDPFILSLPAWQFALTHGDAFCTDDVDYQRFRAMVRQPAWQERFLSQPLAERKQQIEAIRQQSEASKQNKSAETAYQMDVNRNAIEDFLHDHGYPTLIHGHTHLPMTHEHIVDGIHCERWVLADWREGSAPALAPSAEVLFWDGEQLHRQRL